MLDRFDHLVEGSLALAVCCLLVAASLQIGLVLFRYFLGVSSIMVQELVLYAFAAATLIGIPAVVAKDQHVRVDLVYNQLGVAARRRVNGLGLILFTIPVCILMIVTSFPFVELAWRFKEGSAQVGGLPGVFLVKTLVLAMPVLVLVAGTVLFVLRRRHRGS